MRNFRNLTDDQISQLIIFYEKTMGLPVENIQIVTTKKCHHEFLTPSCNRTTCKICGRDGFIYLDVNPDHKIKELENLLSWFTHYIEDKQYEKIIQDKDFELREALKKARAILR